MHFNITVTKEPEAITAIKNAKTLEEIIGILQKHGTTIQEWQEHQPTMRFCDSDSIEYHLPVAIEIDDSTTRHYMWEYGFKTPAERAQWFNEAPDQVERIVLEQGEAWQNWILEDLEFIVEDFGLTNMNLRLLNQ